MTKWFGAATLAFALIVGSGSARPAAAASAAVQQAQLSEVSARRVHQHRSRNVYRPSYPSYYGRPSYYAPAPFFPIPPFFGYGFEPW
jgi:hypothetical protein